MFTNDRTSEMLKHIDSYKRELETLLNDKGIKFQVYQIINSGAFAFYGWKFTFQYDFFDSTKVPDAVISTMTSGYNLGKPMFETCNVPINDDDENPDVYGWLTPSDVTERIVNLLKKNSVAL